jgi:hypothetical protein
MSQEDGLKPDLPITPSCQANEIPELREKELVEFEKEDPAIVQPNPRIYNEVFGNIHDSLGEIKEYYRIDKEQARASFRIGVFFVSLSSILYFGGTYFDAAPKFVSNLSLVNSAIGITYFCLHRISASRMKRFHDKLITVQETMLAVTQCDQIKDVAQRDRMREFLIREIMNRTTRRTVTERIYRAFMRGRQSM